MSEVSEAIARPRAGRTLRSTRRGSRSVSRPPPPTGPRRQVMPRLRCWTKPVGWCTSCSGVSRRARSARPLPDPAAPGGWRVEAWVKTGILLGFRLPGLTEQRDGPIVAGRDRSALGILDLLESDAATGRHGQRGTLAHRPRRHERASRRLPGAGGGHHPAGLRQRRRLGGGGLHDRFARPRRFLRPDRSRCPPRGRESRWGACSNRPAPGRSSSRMAPSWVAAAGSTRASPWAGRAVVGAGVILTGQSRLIDLVRGARAARHTRSAADRAAGAVVVPGTRPASSDWARAQGIASPSRSSSSIATRAPALASPLRTRCGERTGAGAACHRR